MLKNFFWIFVILIPHNSIQLEIISKSTTLEATCVYKYESGNVYACDLLNAIYSDPTDILEITGVHFDNHTDADVQIVNFRSNGTAYFNGEVLKKFENLKELSFYGSGLVEIRQNAFDVCPNLEHIFGSLNQLSTFPPQMLNNCEKLKYFRIYAYSLNQVPEDLFGMATNLENFLLTTFNITSLPEKLLHNMRNLRILDISGNDLTELHPNFLINAPNLEHIDVSLNRFEDETKLTYALNGHPNLKKLFLDNNYFKKFDFRFFAQFQKLESLKISLFYDESTEFSWQSLPSSLLYLTINGIDFDLPSNAFNRLVNLNSLTISGIGFKNLHKDTFKALTSLVSLSVYFTNINELHPELFMNLGNLSDLYLPYNQIELLPAGIFASLVNLGSRNAYEGIFMSANKIERLNANSFGLHPHLRYIIFNSNNINEIEHGIFGKFHPNATFADFSYNRCVNQTFSGENLDANKAFSLCHENWRNIIPTTSPTTERTTTPGGVGRNFNKFEILALIFVNFAMKFVGSN